MTKMIYSLLIPLFLMQVLGCVAPEGTDDVLVEAAIDEEEPIFDPKRADDLVIKNLKINNLNNGTTKLIHPGDILDLTIKEGFTLEVLLDGPRFEVQRVHRVKMSFSNGKVYEDERWPFYACEQENCSLHQGSSTGGVLGNISVLVQMYDDDGFQLGLAEVFWLRFNPEAEVCSSEYSTMINVETGQCVEASDGCAINEYIGLGFEKTSLANCEVAPDLTYCAISYEVMQRPSTLDCKETKTICEQQLYYDLGYRIVNKASCDSDEVDYSNNPGERRKDKDEQRVCTSEFAIMIHPITNDCSEAEDGCVIHDLIKLGYQRSSLADCP